MGLECAWKDSRAHKVDVQDSRAHKIDVLLSDSLDAWDEDQQPAEQQAVTEQEAAQAHHMLLICIDHMVGI